MQSDELRQAIESATPLGRIGDPEDIAAAVVYLASQAGRSSPARSSRWTGASRRPTSTWACPTCEPDCRTGRRWSHDPHRPGRRLEHRQRRRPRHRRHRRPPRPRAGRPVGVQPRPRSGRTPASSPGSAAASGWRPPATPSPLRPPPRRHRAHGHGRPPDARGAWPTSSACCGPGSTWSRAARSSCSTRGRGRRRDDRPAPAGGRGGRASRCS